MSAYLEPIRDGLLMRDTGVGPWTVSKLNYLERYIDLFETSMRDKQWRRRHYIDLFAGPGKCEVDGAIYLGSPLLALTTRYPFTDYFFVDLDPDNIAALDERQKAATGVRVECTMSDANVAVQGIVAKIQAVDKQFIAGSWPSLNLAVLDPEGFELAWDTVQALGSIKKMDLIIYYPEMGLNRGFQVPGMWPHIDRFFGDPAWRSVYQQHRSGQFLHRHLIDFYMSNLQRLGYLPVGGHEPRMLNEKKAPLYRLLFASKDELGRDFWEKTLLKDEHGQTRMPGF